jgi:phosphatidylglycerol---prolipoprotein diacylglyceryl transferase
MHPRLVEFPTIQLFGKQFSPVLPTYGVLMAVAFVVGLWLTHRLASKAGLPASRVVDLAVYTMIGGLIGARLLLVVVEWPYYAKHPRELVSLLQSGGVFYGGFLGALPVAWWYARRHQLDGWRTADVLAPGVALGQAIGRLGCFAAGCCFGRPTDMPWAVRFHDEYAARATGTPLDVPLHPTQLYESGAALLIFLFLLWLSGHKRFQGQVTLTYVALYAVARFIIEYFRGDAARGVVFGGLFSTSQFIALLMLLAAVVLTPRLMRRSPVGPAPA